MCYQITTDNYEQNESSLAPENLIRVSHITTVVYLYPNQTHSYF